MKMTRRRFALTAAAAGATWFDVPQILADTREASLARYGGFPMGIQSFSLRGFGVDGALDKIRELELHWVELVRAHYPPAMNDAKIAEMREKLEARDIGISAHGVEGFWADHERNERFFRFAKAAGIRNITADPSPDAFESLDRLVKQYDIRIAIHNHGPGQRYDKIDDALRAVSKWDPRIGFCADLGHYIRSGEDPVKAVHELGGRLYGVHLKDFAEAKKQTRGVILGEGHLDVEGVFKALKAVKFPADGALSLEYEENPKDPMANIRRCLAVASEAAKKVAAS